MCGLVMLLPHDKGPGPEHSARLEHYLQLCVKQT